MDDGQYSGAHNIEFTEKRWYEAALEYLKFLPSEAPTFAALVISLWALAEVIMAAVGNRAPVANFAAPILTVSVIAISFKAYIRFKNYVPATLKSESPQVKQIFRKQRCGWNMAITRQMLDDRISRAEIELERVMRGAAFILPTHLNGREYFSWLVSRPDTIKRLLRSVSVLCTHDLPNIVGDVKDEGGLSRLQVEVDALAALYLHLKDFEIDCHKVMPPEPFEEVHEMTHGWTEPIRRGVDEFLTVLEQLASLDAKSIKEGTLEPPSFEIKFEAPENLEGFCRRIDLIDPSLILENDLTW